MDLAELREQINDIDTELVTLLTRRMDISLEVAEYKREHNLPVLQSGRENEVLERVASLTKPEYTEHIKQLYREIMAISRQLQQ